VKASACSRAQRTKSFLTEATVHLIPEPESGYQSRIWSPTATGESLLVCAEPGDTAYPMIPSTSRMLKK